MITNLSQTRSSRPRLSALYQDLTQVFNFGLLRCRRVIRMTVGSPKNLEEPIIVGLSLLEGSRLRHQQMRIALAWPTCLCCGANEPEAPLKSKLFHESSSQTRFKTSLRRHELEKLFWNNVIGTYENREGINFASSTRCTAEQVQGETTLR